MQQKFAWYIIGQELEWTAIREVILKETSQRTLLINNKDESVTNKLIGSFEMAENQN